MQYRPNLRMSTDDLLISRAAKCFEDHELAQQPQPLWRADIMGAVLVLILATICLVLAFTPV